MLGHLLAQALRQAGTLALAALVVALVAGCPRRGLEDDPLPGLLATIDRAWAARGTDGFDPVQSALDAAHVVAPSHPEVMWRYVRFEVGRGLAAPDTPAAIRRYSRARAFGVECLVADPDVAEALGAAGWKEALPLVPDAQRPCVMWLTFAWVRWLAAIGGDAGAIDLPEIERLAAAMPGDVRTDPNAVTPWAQGLLAAVRPEDRGRDYEEAVRLLRRAVATRPEELPRRTDMLLFVAVPQGDPELVLRHLEPLRDATPDTPEDRRALERALAVEPPALPPAAPDDPP